MTTIPLPTIEQIRSYARLVGRKHINPRSNDAALYKCIMTHQCGTLPEKLEAQAKARTIYETATIEERIAFIEKVEKYA
jgi:hypothetical protein